jgi:hypothetical protein
MNIYKKIKKKYHILLTSFIISNGLKLLNNPVLFNLSAILSNLFKLICLIFYLFLRTPIINSS